MHTHVSFTVIVIVHIVIVEPTAQRVRFAEVDPGRAEIGAPYLSIPSGSFAGLTPYPCVGREEVAKRSDDS